tara:strand:+ start:701 stop:1576 length:876 start_codon:yes stop_codon:yes gene_type:complete
MLEKKKRQMFLFHLRYFYSTYSYVILKKQKDRELKTKKTTQMIYIFAKRGKDSSFKMKKKIGHHRNISYSEKLLVQMDENEEDDDDGDRFDYNPELEENFGVRTRFNRTVTNSKGEVKKIPLVLLSDSGLKQKWDVFIMVLLAWVSIVTPVQISYLSDFQRLDNIPDWMFLFLIDRLIDIVFVMDMFVSVRTSWLDEHGDEAFQDGKAVTRYLKGFFLIDFLSIFPFQVLLSSVFTYSSPSLSSASSEKTSSSSDSIVVVASLLSKSPPLTSLPSQSSSSFSSSGIDVAFF